MHNTLMQVKSGQIFCFARVNRKSITCLTYKLNKAKTRTRKYYSIGIPLPKY